MSVLQTTQQGLAPQGCGTESHLCPVFAGVACFPCAVRVSTGYSNFLPQSKYMHCRLAVLCIVPYDGLARCPCAQRSKKKKG